MKKILIILVLLFSFVNINNAYAASIGDACMWSTDCSTNFCQPKAFGGGAKICCDIQATYCDIDGYGGCPVYACSGFGAECGTFDDGCGGTKSCGDCSVYGGAKPYCQKGTCVSSCSGQFCGSGVVFQYTSSCGMGPVIQDCSALGSDSYSSWTCNGNIKERTKTTTDGICNNHANGCVETTVGSNKESVDCSASGQVCSGGNCVNPTCTASCDTCSGFSDVCDTTGTQTCTRADCSTYSQACTRVTDGTACTGGTCSGGTCVSSASCASPTPSWTGVVTNVGSPSSSGQAWIYDDTSPYNACSWRCNTGYVKGTGNSCVLSSTVCSSTNCGACTSSNCISAGCTWSTKNPTTGQDIGASNYHCCPSGNYWWNPDIGICATYATCSPQFGTNPLQGYNSYQQACCVFNPGIYTYQNIVPI